jgi:23S rRNA (cytidine1920-2'-O)/16S rRNA (cytidine1409-2'-O)-methyltransferase
VAAAEPILIQGEPPRFVSRGGEKLDAALERFGIDVDGWRAIDAGASTGGFTDCLLQRGVRFVLAVDVGHGQIDARLRADSRVLLKERTNIRTLDLADLPAPHDPVDLVTADLSFISLRTVAPVLAGPLLRAGGHLVILVKPQFEAGRADVSRGRGVIRDPAVWRRALDGACSALDDAGTGIMEAMTSPITGSAGNAEFLVHAVKGSADMDALDGRLSEVVTEATSMLGGRLVTPDPPGGS